MFPSKCINHWMNWIRLSKSSVLYLGTKDFLSHFDSLAIIRQHCRFWVLKTSCSEGIHLIMRLYHNNCNKKIFIITHLPQSHALPCFVYGLTMSLLPLEYLPLKYTAESKGNITTDSNGTRSFLDWSVCFTLVSLGVKFQRF